MEKVKKNLNELIRLLRSKPELILKEDPKKLPTYISFFQGYFMCAKLTQGKSLERKLSKWYQDRADFKAPNMNWFSQFELIHKGKGEEEIIGLLLDDIEAFFDESELD